MRSKFFSKKMSLFVSGFLSGVFIIAGISTIVLVNLTKEIRSHKNHPKRMQWNDMPSKNVFYEDKKTEIPKYDGAELINLGDVFCGNIVSDGYKNEDIINHKFWATMQTMDVTHENIDYPGLPNYPQSVSYNGMSRIKMCRVLLVETIPCDDVFYEFASTQHMKKGFWEHRIKSTADYFGVDGCGRILLLESKDLQPEKNENIDLYTAMRIHDKWQIVY